MTHQVIFKKNNDFHLFFILIACHGWKTPYSFRGDYCTLLSRDIKPVITKTIIKSLPAGRRETKLRLPLSTNFSINKATQNQILLKNLINRSVQNKSHIPPKRHKLPGGRLSLKKVKILMARKPYPYFLLINNLNT